MKQIFIFCIVLFALNANAQFKQEFQLETPDTSSASQTHYVYPTGTSGATETGYGDNGSLAIVIKTDSLSGATAGTVSIEFAADDAGTIWVPWTTTLTVNGAASQYLTYDDDNFSYYKWRAKIVNTGATQSNKMQVAWAYKRRD